MEAVKLILSFIIGAILAVLVIGLIKDFLPSEGIAPLFLGLAIFGASIFLVMEIFESLFKTSKKQNKEQEKKSVDNSQLKNKDDLKSLYIRDYNLVTSAFYEFCFSPYYAKVILGTEEVSYHLRQVMKEYQSQKDAVSLILFSRMAKTKGITIEVYEVIDQEYNSFQFTIKAQRIPLDTKNNYLEVMSNDFGETTEANLPMSVATRYIIHFENDQPVYIYAVVKTFLLQSFTLRKVNVDGSSSNLGRLKDDNIHTIVEFINNRIKNH